MIISFSKRTLLHGERERVKFYELLAKSSVYHWPILMICHPCVKYLHELVQLRRNDVSLLCNYWILNGRKVWPTEFGICQTGYRSENSVNNFATFIMRAAREGYRSKGSKTTLVPTIVVSSVLQTVFVNRNKLWSLGRVNSKRNQAEMFVSCLSPYPMRSLPFLQCTWYMDLRYL